MCVRVFVCTFFYCDTLSLLRVFFFNDIQGYVCVVLFAKGNIFQFPNRQFFSHIIFAFILFVHPNTIFCNKYMGFVVFVIFTMMVSPSVSIFFYIKQQTIVKFLQQFLHSDHCITPLCILALKFKVNIIQDASFNQLNVYI